MERMDRRIAAARDQEMRDTRIIRQNPIDKQQDELIERQAEKERKTCRYENVPRVPPVALQPPLTCYRQHQKRTPIAEIEIIRTSAKTLLCAHPSHNAVSSLPISSHGHAGDARTKLPPAAPISNPKCNCNAKCEFALIRLFWRGLSQLEARDDCRIIAPSRRGLWPPQQQAKGLGRPLGIRDCHRHDKSAS